jgi:hypothetical protein
LTFFIKKGSIDVMASYKMAVLAEIGINFIQYQTTPNIVIAIARSDSLFEPCHPKQSRSGSSLAAHDGVTAYFF